MITNKKLSLSVKASGKASHGKQVLPLCIWCCKPIRSDEASEVVYADLVIHIHCRELWAEFTERTKLPKKP